MPHLPWIIMYMLSAWSPWLNNRCQGLNFYSLMDYANSMRSSLSRFKYYLMKRRFLNKSITPSRPYSERLCGSLASSVIMSPLRNAVNGHNTYLFEALEPFVTVLELVKHAGDFGHLSSYEIDLHVFCELIAEPLQPFLVLGVEVDF